MGKQRGAQIPIKPEGTNVTWCLFEMKQQEHRRKGRVTLNDMSSFPGFMEAMRGKKLLHLGQKDADCDALGSAFALT
jgi:c-di-AMP phosphodiesterase-like protein